ncbi:MAG: hypothetical protein ACRCSB_02610 [Bacteroidales bacterium]
MKKNEIIIALITIGFIVVSIIGFRLWSSKTKEKNEMQKSNTYANQNLQDTVNAVVMLKDKVETETKKRDTLLYWHTIYDTILREERLACDTLLDIDLSPINVINQLNKRDIDCKIEYQGLLGDTLIVKFTNDELLTEQMGTTGAYCFLAETFCTLMSIKTLRCVNFAISPGSHAGPVVNCRGDYQDLIHDVN